MKKRIFISNILTFLVIIISKPESLKLFLTGLVFVITGEIVRIISSACIKKNASLSVNGPYSLCRNPLYLGTFLIIIGILIQISSSHIIETVISWLIVLTVFPYVYYVTIKSEEKFLNEKFGNEFSDYVKRVPCIIPRISCISEIFKIENYSYANFIKNKEYRGIFSVIGIETIILFKLLYNNHE